MTLPRQSNWFRPREPCWGYRIIIDSQTTIEQDSRVGRGLEVLDWIAEHVPEVIASLAKEPHELTINLWELPAGADPPPAFRIE